MRNISITITSVFHIIKAVSPAGENSHFMFMEVINAEITLELPFTKKSILRIFSYLAVPKIKAIKINERPIPPQPYISSAQAKEPGFAIVKTGNTYAVSGGLLTARYGT